MKSPPYTHERSGFVLPTVLVLSVVLLTLGLSVFQLTSSIARSLTDQYWQRLARQSSQAGISYMSACVDQGLSGSTWPISITQDNTCLGGPLGTSQPSIYTNTGDANPIPNPFQSRFIIYKPTTGADGIPKARVVGAVDVLSSPNSSGVRTTIKTYTYEMISIINGPTRATDYIAAGFWGPCVSSDSSVYCWGQNNYGQLGNGNTTNSNVPVGPVAGLLADKRVDKTAVGNYHSCAIANGQVYCWGSNTSGQLGNGNTTNSNVPVGPVAGLLAGKVVVDIIIGNSHSCAIANGQVYCWGSNTSGQLGNGNTTNSNVPVGPVAGLLSGKVVTQVVAGFGYTCAIANSQVYCWGENSYGQLGNGTTTTSNVPVGPVAGLLSGKVVTQISGGENHVCAIANGQIYCWGGNWDGRLGNGGTATSNSVPVGPVAGLLSGKFVTHVAAAHSHTCAIANGQIYCWGANNTGQLGNGNTGSSTIPVAVDMSGVMAGQQATRVAGNFQYTCAIANGQIYCWGANNTGQLGNGNTTNSNVPVKSINSF